MISDLAHTTDTVVSTLLLMADRVLEVSRDGAIVNEWASPEGEGKMTPADSNALVYKLSYLVKACIDEKKNESLEYSITSGDTVSKYKVRVLSGQPGRMDNVLVAIELLSAKKVGKITELVWKQVLDASGDGMWDVNIPEQTISFSARWHKTFGHASQDIRTIADWVAMIHPDDRNAALHNKDEYLEDGMTSYRSEFRVLCSDGSYKWVMSKGMIVARDNDGKPLRFIGTHTDINAHRTAEERYFSTAQLLSKLINNLHDGVLVIDENKKILYANQMFCDIYNVSEHPSLLIGMDVYQSIASRMPFYKDPQRFYDRTVEVLTRQEIVLNEEWEMVNGKIIGRDHIPLTLGKDNKGCIWKFRDITVQKNTEKQLADLRNFYEQILNQIAADIVVFDDELRYLFINPTAIKNKELREWMIGKTDEDYCRVRNRSFELVERRRRIFDEAIATRHNVEWEEMLVNKDGEPEYHLRNHYPVFDEQGKHVMSIGYGLNITDRVKAQQELQTSRDTFASAFNDSGIGMALLSHEGMWLDANSVLCEITGYTKEELQRLSLKDITHPEDVNTYREQVERMLRREISTYNGEKRLVSKRGATLLVSFTLSLVRTNDGLPKFFIVQVIDITGKKEMELELRKKNEELELARQNLLNKVNQLEDLSHIIAHNLRGPAGNIKMLSETLLEQQTQRNNGEPAQDEVFTQDEALLLIHDSSMSLMDSLSTLMQITQIKLNKEIPKDDCDVVAIVNDICNQLQSAILEKQAVVRIKLDVTRVQYPKAYLENILYNLISNALKYTISGLVPEIDITTEMQDGHVCIVVRDNGLGIDMDKYGDRLFKLNQVFHQGFESKGIGLYITRTTVESLGGKIEVKSAPNEGSEFIVTL
ncbi:hypothetical protein GCM10023093_25430 [Nemorincola caseinilytica]|uniref:histidine kinase n=1 Tax=Nemorincola caseinilytica TaxID=2054315 RepID=A0ABP8NMC8_9BACT